MAGNFNQERLLARLTEAFGFLALILASVGLYGVTSIRLLARTSEIGDSHGAGSFTLARAIVSLMLRTAFLQVIAGVAIGVPVSLAVGQMMKRVLYEMSANDPIAFICAATVLGACMAVAAMIPAARAASLDPMQALRTE